MKKKTAARLQHALLAVALVFVAFYLLSGPWKQTGGLAAGGDGPCPLPPTYSGPPLGDVQLPAECIGDT